MCFDVVQIYITNRDMRKRKRRYSWNTVKLMFSRLNFDL